jgi:hypothetical protein
MPVQPRQVAQSVFWIAARIVIGPLPASLPVSAKLQVMFKIPVSSRDERTPIWAASVENVL